VSDDPWVVALSAALAVSAVAVPRLWSWTRHVSTIVHEAGHAVVALLTGRRLAGIRLHSDSSGVTVSVGRPRGPGMVAMLAAGYPAPALLGLGAVALLRAGRADVLLWGLVVVLAGLALQIRNWFGAWTILATGAVVFAVTWWLPADWHRAFAYLVTWFLLLSGPREVLGLYAARRGHGRRRGARGSDADQLARLTHLPAGLWSALFLLVCLGAAVLGIWLLR
jgi:Peptidase M50B-like